MVFSGSCQGRPDRGGWSELMNIRDSMLFRPWNFGWNRGALMAALWRSLEVAAAGRDAGKLEPFPAEEAAWRTATDATG